MLFARLLGFSEDDDRVTPNKGTLKSHIITRVYERVIKGGGVTRL